MIAESTTALTLVKTLEVISPFVKKVKKVGVARLRSEMIFCAFEPELGLLHLRTFVVRKYQNFFGAQVGALFSNFG